MITKAKTTKTKTSKTASTRTRKAPVARVSKTTCARRTSSCKKTGKVEQDYRAFILTMVFACLLVATAVVMVGIKVQNDNLAALENAAHSVHYDGDLYEE